MNKSGNVEVTGQHQPNGINATAHKTKGKTWSPTADQVAYAADLAEVARTVDELQVDQRVAQNAYKARHAFRLRRILATIGTVLLLIIGSTSARHIEDEQNGCRVVPVLPDKASRPAVTASEASGVEANRKIERQPVMCAPMGGHNQRSRDPHARTEDDGRLLQAGYGFATFDNMSAYGNWVIQIFTSGHSGAIITPSSSNLECTPYSADDWTCTCKVTPCDYVDVSITGTGDDTYISMYLDAPVKADNGLAYVRIGGTNGYLQATTPIYGTAIIAHKQPYDEVRVHRPIAMQWTGIRSILRGTAKLYTTGISDELHYCLIDDTTPWTKHGGVDPLVTSCLDRRRGLYVESLGGRSPTRYLNPAVVAVAIELTEGAAAFGIEGVGVGVVGDLGGATLGAGEELIIVGNGLWVGAQAIASVATQSSGAKKIQLIFNAGIATFRTNSGGYTVTGLSEGAAEWSLGSGTRAFSFPAWEAIEGGRRAVTTVGSGGFNVILDLTENSPGLVVQLIRTFAGV